MTDTAYTLLGFFMCLTIISASFIPAFIASRRHHTHPYMVTGLGIYGMLIPFILHSAGWGVIWVAAIVWAWVGKTR